jgi:ribonucleoside-diphosphate reductase alpha chain
MISLLDEEKKLKALAILPNEQKQTFLWSALVASIPPVTSPIKVAADGGIYDLNPGEIADTIGTAVADLAIARGQTEIYNSENKNLVQTITLAVIAELTTAAAGTAITISGQELSQAIEKALVRANRHEVARGVVLRRQRKVKGRSLPQPILVHTKVIRRNGQLIAWNHSRIEDAVRKAFLNVNQDSSPAMQIAEALALQMVNEARQYITIEDLQNLVEEELMRQGHFKVARAYIQYRSLRATIREEEETKRLLDAPGDTQQSSFVLVQASPTETFLWDGQDLKKRIEFASMGLDLCIDRQEIEAELRRSIFEQITISQLRATIVLNSKSLMQYDADFAKFSARILLTYIYEEVLGWDIVRDGVEQLAKFHREAFRNNLQRAIEIDRVHPDLWNYDLDKLADAIDPVADLDFDFIGIQTLFDRYLIVDKKTTPARRLESPQLFWMRVSMGLFLREHREGQAGTTEHVIALYRMYKSRRFCSSTPTLFNSGTMHTQLSSCYLYKVDDSIESIMQRGIADNAYLSKWAGGLGGSWTSVRGTGGYIAGTNGESQGVIPFLKLHNDQLIAVNQGGKRRGSGCAYLEVWHNDIMDFLELRVGNGDERRRTPDLNTANWIPDLFMKRFEERQNWTLFRANEVPDLHDLYGRAFEARYVEYEQMAAEGKIWGKTIEAVDLWKRMLRMIFETGHPWITFKDPCNVRSPQDHVGVIHSSNLCTEITLNTSEDETAVCNLGSILIDNHLDDNNRIDHTKLRETIRTAVRVLDNVIDINFYPTPSAKTANTRHRPVGLGVMGLAYALYRKGIPFASKEALDFNDEFLEAVAYYAYEASSDLAAERGTYQSYKGSKWDRGILPQDTVDLLEKERGIEIDVVRGGKMDWTNLREKIRKNGMRNSNVLAIAPTATISNIMGSSPCIEPMFTNCYTKSNLSGQFVVLNPYLVRDLKKRGLWTSDIQSSLKRSQGELESIEDIPGDLKRKYATAFAIDPNAILEAAARRQKWIDQSQSVNLWFGELDMRSLSMMYRNAWRKGLKTTYYLRTKAASEIEQSTEDVKKVQTGIIGATTASEALGLMPVAPPPAAVPPVVAVAPATPMPQQQSFTLEEALQCSIDAMKNGGTCEACQ